MNPQINQDNQADGQKEESFLKIYIEEAKKIGWKKFWKLNNKAIVFLLKLLLAAFIFGVIESTSVVRSIKTEQNAAKIYFVLTLIAFVLTVGNQVITYFQMGIKQDFNSSQFQRVKEKTKGVDWRKAESPYNEKKKK